MVVLKRSEQPVFCSGYLTGTLRMKIASSFAPRWTAFGCAWATGVPLLRYVFALHCSSQLSARHPQIGQRELRFDLSRVLRQAAVPRLHISKLPFQHAERMLHLRSHARFQPFDLVVDLIEPLRLVQLSALARPHRDVPLDCTRFASLLNALVARIGKCNLLFAVQQRMRLATAKSFEDRR